MLFDHGCDSIAVGTQVLVLPKFCNSGDNLWTLAPGVLIISIFFTAMLEEYYKGIMVLPVGNGVSDGSIVLIAIYTCFGIFGSEWASTTLFTVAGCDLNFSRILCIFLTVVMPTMMANYFAGIFSTIGKELPDGLYGEKFHWPDFISQVFGYFGAVAAIVGLTFIGDKPIAFNPAPQDEVSYMLPIIILINAVQAFCSISMQVKHVAR